MKLKTCFFFLIVFSFIGCKVKLNGTSEEQFKISKAQVLRGLPTDKQKKLEIALHVVDSYSKLEKKENYGKYWDTPINKITLDALDNKTYKELVRFAEDFLKKENEKEIEKIQIEISELQLNRKNSDSIITILNDFKPTEVYIQKYKSDDPSLKIKIQNKGDLTGITSFMFDIKIYSISQNRIIEHVGLGRSNLSGISKGKDDYFPTLSTTLALLTRRSKRLVKQLEQAESPIKNLSDFDLYVKITPSKIEMLNGTRYDYPYKSISEYDNEIKALQNRLEQIKSLDGTLNEYVLKEVNSKKEIAYNEEYLPILEEIRAENNRSNTSALKVSKDLSINFPSKYEIIKEKSEEYYSVNLCNDLSFDIYDEDLIQYQIKDTLYVEFDQIDDKANGVLNVLKDQNTSCSIKEIVNKFIDSNIYKSTSSYKLIEHDNSGYMYFEYDRYKFIRYFNLNGIHYCYDMDFENLKECVLEFDRSKELIK
ncbi:hypothetical protein [Aquimarina algicola]|uniref:Uncharacterized protein n=1 Tax=Aquimarina algicola TaxID=2589995 RepID=A0A504JGP3_9FLAO|nr:hypothetical protein [Aquimarina algicola]TPN86843.1 hypothetical protein FHK87_04370 [Aquimarina algicola]